MANKSHSATGDLPSEGYVRLPQILAKFPVSRSAWLAGVKSGRYPAAIKLGPRTTAWKASDIRALLENPPLSEPAKIPTRNTKQLTS